MSGLAKESVLNNADMKFCQLQTYHTRFIIQGRALDAINLTAVFGLPHEDRVAMETHLDARMILKPTMANSAVAV